MRRVVTRANVGRVFNEAYGCKSPQGRYSLFDEDMVLKERSDKRKLMRWVKEKQIEPADNGAEDCLHGQTEADFWKVDEAKPVLDRVQTMAEVYSRWVRECPVEFQRIGLKEPPLFI